MTERSIDYAARLARLRERMAETGTDLVALGPTSNMVWLSGLDPHGDERPVLQIVTRDFAGFLMPALNADSQRGLTDQPFFCWADETGPEQAFTELLAAAGIDGPVAVALDPTMRADFALLVVDAVHISRRDWLTETLGHLRQRKDDGEFAVLKANALMNDRAMRAGFDSLRPGITEREVAEVITAHYAAEGAVPEFLSVCFGANGAFPHHSCSERRLEPETPVLIDIGGRRDGYPSDMTRAGWFGTTPSAAFMELHGIAERAVRAALAAARPGVPTSAVDAAARGVITEAGHGAHFPHRTGHGLGIDIHEDPYVTASSDAPLDSGMVFSIEPGIYLPGEFGLRLEEIVILRDNGPEILSEMPRAPVITPGLAD